MLKLSDIQAPVWVWKPNAEKTHRMRPLSLATFAEAELMGCGLDNLLSRNEQVALEAWINLYAFLGDIPQEEAALEIMTNPKMFEAFSQQVQLTFLPPDDDEESSRGKSHRKSKDPRNKIKIPDGASMRSEDSDSPSTQTDYSIFFDLARLAKISISDLYKMTFKGLIALTKHLERNPPVPNGMFGDTI